jgi:hypothetical protein
MQQHHTNSQALTSPFTSSLPELSAKLRQTQAELPQAVFYAWRIQFMLVVVNAEINRFVISISRFV